MLLNEFFDAWRSLGRAKQRKRVQPGTRQGGTESLEVRQLLTTFVDHLFDGSLAGRFGNSDVFTEHVATFSAQKNTESLRVATGATSVVPTQFLTNGYQFTFSTPRSMQSAYQTFSAVADFTNFSPVFSQQREKRLVPNDPLYVDQWHLNNTGQGGGTPGLDANVEGVWDTHRGAGVVIGVVDDGVQLTHEDLAANVRAGLHFDWNGGDTDPSPNVAQDYHGTAVAGVAAGVGNNGLGISGAAPEAGIAGLRLIAGPSSDLDEAQALTWLNNQIHIYNNSWGPTDNGRIAGIGPQAEAALRQGFTAGRNGLGSIFVWAGGNGGTRQDNVNYDAYANSRYTIAVGALDQNGIRAPYSEPGAPLIVTGYTQGSGIATTTTDLMGDDGYNSDGANDGDSLADTNYTSTFNGTSSATPLVAGVIALMLEANPALTSREVQDILVQTARRTDLTNPDWTQNGAGLWVSHDYGYGAIDAQAAVNAALTYVPLAAEISRSTGIRTVNATIPDGFGVVRNSVTVTDRVSLEYVEVYFSATHTNRGQLNVTLISPSGTRSILAATRTVDDNGATDPGYSRWRFTSARHWDESSEGTWTIEVSDPVSGETGTFNSYELVFYGTDFDIPVPSVPQIIAPVGIIASVSPVYQWSTSTHGVAYDLQVTRANGAVVLSRSGLTTTSFVQPTRLAEGTYYTTVRAMNAESEYSEWSAPVEFIVEIPAAATPVITRPQGDIANSFPVFEWTSSPDAATFTLWVTRMDTLERVIHRTNFVDSTYVHFDPLPDATYRAWVRAFNAVGKSSAWSNFVEFTIDAPAPVAPTLTAPAPITTGPNPRFVWTPVDGAARYDIWVNNLSTGKSQYLRREDISRTATFYDPPAFAQGSYVAWIRAANGNNELSPWSSGHSFTVDILPPSTTRLTGPLGANGVTTVETLNPTFTWDAALRAVRYDLWVNNMTTGKAQIIRRDDITTTSFTSTTNLPQGEYRAFVRGINSANEVGEWSPVFVFLIDEPTPTVPQIIAPAANLAGVVDTANPTFVWTAETSSPLYELEVNNISLNKAKVISVKGIAAETYTVPSNQRLGEYTYTARVRAYNNSGEISDWSQPFRFRIDIPAPTTPVIIGPTGTSRDTTPQFSWVHTASSYRYEILVRDLVRNENIVLNVTVFQLNPQGTQAYYVLPDNRALRPSTYRFWIRSFNALGQSSAWSNSQTFVISAQLDPNLFESSPVGNEVLLTSLLKPMLGLAAASPASAVSEAKFIAYETELELPAEDADYSQDIALIDVAMEMMADPAS